MKGLGAIYGSENCIRWRGKVEDGMQRLGEFQVKRGRRWSILCVGAQPSLMSAMNGYSSAHGASTAASNILWVHISDLTTGERYLLHRRRFGKDRFPAMNPWMKKVLMQNFSER